MGAGASTTENEQMCFGYWDTSTNSIHMVRLNTPSALITSTIKEEMEEDENDDDSGHISNSCSVISSNSDEENDDASVLSTATRDTTARSLKKCGRRLSDANLVPQRLKLQRIGVHGPTINIAPGTKNDRRVSHVELQELESVTMPMKAAKVLIGNPMKVNSYNLVNNESDDEDISPRSANCNFDVVSLRSQRRLPAIPKSPRPMRLPQIHSQTQLVTRKSRTATLLKAHDTQITMVMPKKAAQLLLGDGQLEDNSSALEERRASSQLTECSTASTFSKKINSSQTWKPIAATNISNC